MGICVHVCMTAKIVMALFRIMILPPELASLSLAIVIKPVTVENRKGEEQNSVLDITMYP